MNIVTVNGNVQIRTNIWDTPSTIKLKISEVLNVPIRWIHVTGNIYSSDIEVVTLPEIINTHLRDDKDLTDLKAENDSMFPNVPIDDYITLWYQLYQDKYGRISDEFSFEDLSIAYRQKYGNQYSISDDYRSFELALNQRIRQDNELKKRRVELLRDMRLAGDTITAFFIGHDLSSSDFRKTSETSKIAFTTNDDIVSIFEHKHASETVPFIAMNAPNSRVTSVFRVDNMSPIPSEWAVKHLNVKRNAIESTDTIQMKVLTVPTDDPGYRTARNGVELHILPTGREVNTVPKVIEHGLYTDVDFEESTSGKFMHIKLSSAATQRRGLIEHRAVEDLSIVLGKRSISDIKGEFNVSGVDIDSDSFNLMISLDPTMSSFALLDETSKVASEKATVQFRLYQITDKGITPFCNVLIMQKIVGIGGVLEVGRHRLTTNSTYLTIKLSKIKEEFVDRVNDGLIPLILALLNIYNAKKGSYLEDIATNVRMGTVSKKRVRTKEQSRIDILRSHAPYLFLTTTYARRRCSKVRQPTIDDQYPVTMKYPIKGESKDGMQFLTHSYACPDQKYPYPGLVRTKPEDANYDVFKFVPCCFDKDQSSIPSSPFNEYFNPEDFEVPLSLVKPVGKHIIGTSKFLDPGRDGSLPSNVEEFFSVKVLRTGVQRSMSSVIHCILMAIDYDGYYEIGEVEDRENHVLQLRNSLDQINISVCSQETLRVSNLSDLYDSNVYLDPSIYYRVLEEKFDVNIVVFGFAAGSTTVGTLRPPEHQPPYLKYLNDSRETVYIFEHSGSEINRATYPQCELIVQIVGGERVSRFPIDTYHLSVDILSFMTRARRWGNLIGFTTTTKHLIRDESMIAGQIIGPMGKARVFVTDKMNLVLFGGYPPINVEKVTNIEIADDVLYASEVIEDVRALFPHVKRFKKIVDGTKLVGIEAVNLGVVPWVVGDESGDKLEVSDKLRYMYTQIEVFGHVRSNNLYDDMKRQRRIADHLRQLAVVMFSRKNDGKLDELENRLNEFKRSAFEIDSGVRNTTVFVRQLNESTLVRNGKILVPSADVITRLMYYLEAVAYNDPKYVELSRGQQYINYFFEVSDDFSHTSRESVFGDARELYLYLQATYSHMMHVSDELVGYDRVRMDGYVFRREDVECGKTFWIQPVKDGCIRRAIRVAVTWNDRRMNTGFYSPELKDNVSYRTVDVSTGSSQGSLSDGVTLLRDDERYMAMNQID
jgi:hypothetical protein